MGLITPRSCRAICHVAESFADSAPNSHLAKWLYGVILPAAILVYGASCCWSMQATLGGGGGKIPLAGISAIAYGIVWINFASLLHFHYFWGNVERLCGLSDLGKTLAALGIISGLGYLAYHFIMLE